MDNPGAIDAADTRKLSEMMEQAGHQRASSMPGPRMHHHTCRLVQHRKNGVLEEDLEWHFLGAGRFAWGERRFAPDDLIVGTDDLCSLGRHAIDQHPAGANHRLDSRARDGG